MGVPLREPLRHPAGIAVRAATPAPGHQVPSPLRPVDVLVDRVELGPRFGGLEVLLGLLGDVLRRDPTARCGLDGLLPGLNLLLRVQRDEWTDLGLIAGQHFDLFTIVNTVYHFRGMDELSR